MNIQSENNVIFFISFLSYLVHLQNGHTTTGARRGNSAELVQPEEKGGRLRMKETFDVEENGTKAKVPLRERLAQRNREKTEQQSSTESPSSSTHSLPKITTNNEDAGLAPGEHSGERRPSESGGENRRMRLRMMYGSSVDKNDQELADDINKMSLSQSIADRKAASEKDKISEKEEKATPK